MLGQRIISALVLIPLAVGAVFLGGRYLVGLVVLFALAMGWEWVRVCHGGRFVASGLVVLFAAVGCILAYHFASPPVALAVLAAGAVVAVVVAESSLRLWHGLGTLYVGIPCLAMLWIREEHFGLDILLWTLLLVWSVDTGAYLVGRAIGGPKLAPSISPKKTWAGFAGGLLAAALVATLGAQWLGLQSWWPVAAVVGIVLSVVEQGGDLAESAFKRRFGVKDSSNLIPGHGGVLDRVDGLLAVLVAVAGLMIVTKGGVRTWQ